MAVIKNYTTTISADKTCGEMQSLLAKSGVARCSADSGTEPVITASRTSPPERLDIPSRDDR